MMDAMVATWKRRETGWRKSRLLQLCQSAHWLLAENTTRYLHWLSATHDAAVRIDRFTESVRS